MYTGRRIKRTVLIIIAILSIFINISHCKSQENEKILMEYINNGYNGQQLNQRNTLLRFQAENNLVVDGIIGQNTNKALNNINKKMVDIIPKEVSRENWFITINKTNRILTVYNKGLVLKKYPVALGKDSTTTPNYKFTIINKIKDPAWGGMGGRFKPIRGGAPNNPLGKRWLGLSRDKYTGYGIHGNSSPFSVGKNISAGCIRMINEDVEEIFEYIPAKTKVWVGTEEVLKKWGVKQYMTYEEPEKKNNINLEDEKRELMSEALKKIPKIESDCHLYGNVRPETMHELLLQEGEQLEAKDIKEFEKLVMIKEECNSPKEYLQKFGYPLKVMQKQGNIERITYELLEDLSKQNIKYVEIKFAPLLHMEEGLTFDEVVDGVLKGMNRAKDDFNILSNAILICMGSEYGEKEALRNIIQDELKNHGL